MVLSCSVAPTSGKRAGINRQAETVRLGCRDIQRKQRNVQLRWCEQAVVVRPGIENRAVRLRANDVDLVLPWRGRHVGDRPVAIAIDEAGTVLRASRCSPSPAVLLRRTPATEPARRRRRRECRRPEASAGGAERAPWWLLRVGCSGDSWAGFRCFHWAASGRFARPCCAPCVRG